MAKVSGHDFVVPSHPAMKMLDEATPETMDIRAKSEYQDIDAPMDFLGGGGSQSKKFSQPGKMRFLTE